MRIKLKASTPVAFIDIGVKSGIPDLCRDGGVIALHYVRGKSSAVDYVICDTNSIESISFGLQENLNEILSEYLWLHSHKFYDYDLWYKNGVYDSLIGNNDIDGLPWNSNYLKNDIFYQHALVQQNLGELSVRIGSSETIETHFSTNKPTYFNP